VKGRIPRSATREGEASPPQGKGLLLGRRKEKGKGILSLYKYAGLKKRKEFYPS